MIRIELESSWEKMLLVRNFLTTIEQLEVAKRYCWLRVVSQGRISNRGTVAEIINLHLKMKQVELEK
jgi:hypothetical protein